MTYNIHRPYNVYSTDSQSNLYFVDIADSYLEAVDKIKSYKEDGSTEKYVIIEPHHIVEKLKVF